MAHIQLSASQLEVIEAYPIKNELDSFRTKWMETWTGGDQIDSYKEFIADPNAKTLSLQLLYALQALPVALALPSEDGTSTLDRDIVLFNARIVSDQTEFDNTAQLIWTLARDVVAEDLDDVKIWTTVYNLIRKPLVVTHLTTPPRSDAFSKSDAASFQQTPWTFNTSSAVDTSDWRKDFDPILRAEMENNIIIDHPKLFDTFFGQVSDLPEVAAAVFDMCKDTEPPLYKEGIGWKEWPGRCEESSVLRWLCSHIDQFQQFADKCGFPSAKRRSCIAIPTQPISGSAGIRKLDFGLGYATSGSKPNWKQILVPGELKSNEREDNHRSTWEDLIRYVREIFSAQERRFVLGFTLCGSTMRLWEFDRLGGVASKSFDINKDGHFFVLVIMGYLWMNEEQLGFDTTIVESTSREAATMSESSGKYTLIQRNGKTERLCLQGQIKRQNCVAGRATTCWKGCISGGKSEGRLAIKDSWEYEERPEEGLLLKEAIEAGVQNVARYYHHETVRTGGTVDDVRHNIRKELNDADGKIPPPASLRLFMSSPNTVSGRTSTGSRSTSESKRVTRKRSSGSLGQIFMPPPKRSQTCSKSPEKSEAQQPLRNRVHRRVIMSDVGKTLYSASSLGAVLTGLLGGVKGHESLLNAGIIHRDISIGNIMLNEVEDDGFLIDLDLAIKINRDKASGAPSKTGTKVFMAIGTLYGHEEHNFMHDLESFFWVLFWLCITWNGAGRPTSVKRQYESWNYKSTQELAKIKKGTVDEEAEFTVEVNENFTAYCQPLIPCILELRKVVFPKGKRRREEDSMLYSQIKSVLEAARKELRTD